MNILKFIEQFVASFQQAITDYEAGITKRVIALQDVFFDEYAPLLYDELDRQNGLLIDTPSNIRKANNVELIFNRFQAAHINRELRTFASELLAVGGLSADYYKGIGFAETEIQINAALDRLRAVIGVNAENELLDGGYLWRLGRTDELRGQLRQYVVDSVSSRVPYSQFKRGFEVLVRGNKDADGFLQRYWQQYAYDTYNQANEIVSGHIADNLGLDWFVYQGSIIDTTRRFCEKKAGKVFSRKEGAKWKDDPDLVDKKTKATYNWQLERGRYNCRHFLTWISYETAKTLRSDI